MVRQRLVARAADFHILLEDVALTHINFSPEKKKTIIHAEGEKVSAAMIGDAIKNNPGFIELRRIQVAKEVAGLLSKSSNRLVLSTDSLLLNLMGSSNTSENMDKAEKANKK